MTETQRAYLSDMNAVSFGSTNRVPEDLDHASITWAGKVLNLGTKVALRFVFDAGEYTEEISEFTLRISNTDIDGNLNIVTVGSAELYNATMGFYAFTVDSLLAAELRAVISAQIFLGDTPVSPTLQYSADTYGNNKTGSLLDLCKALFAYSDSARSYFTAQ